MLKLDVCILRNVPSAFEIKKELFEPGLLAKNYGNNIVDVVNQDPNSTLMEISRRNV